MSIKLSVIVPVYNGKDTIVQALNSLCNQKNWAINTDYEVIVIDDGSTDNSLDMIRELPVKVIRLAQNSGRIIARETGVRSALCENLLLIDSRVIAAPDLLVNYEKIAATHPISICGDLGESDPENSIVDNLYIALRSKYYAPPYPQTSEFIKITQDNFDRVPKGTTCLFIDRKSFLDSLPEDKGKHVNDDAKLFSKIIFEQKKPIYRVLSLKVKYLQRQSLASQKKWLKERGFRFVDFILFKRKIFLVAYIASWLALTSIVVCAITNTPLLLNLIVFVISIYLVGVAWLARSVSEFFGFAKLLPPMLYYFWMGVGQGIYRLAKKRILPENQPI